MQLKLLNVEFAVCKLARAEQVPWEAQFVFVGKTDEELSLVCPVESVPMECLQQERGWRCFRVEGPLNFTLVGILSKITGVLAERQIPVFAVSTFDTDYLLVRTDHLCQARTALELAGYTFV